jgi:hypothetical protein
MAQGPVPNGDRKGYHGDCLICVGITVSGTFPDLVFDTTEVDKEDCHETCFGSEGLNEALLAARAGNLRAVVAHGRRTGGRVTYNDARHEVQILNCRGTSVLASMSVPKHLRFSAAAVLPEVHVAMRRFAHHGNVSSERSTQPTALVFGLVAVFLLPTVGLCATISKRQIHG